MFGAGVQYFAIVSISFLNVVSVANAEIITSSAVSDEIILETTVDWVSPARMLFDINIKSCDEGYKTSIRTKDVLVEVESQLPGLLDRMAQAVLSKCQQIMPELMERQRAQARARASQYLTSTEMRRAYPLIERVAVLRRQIRFDLQPGQKVGGASVQVPEPSEIPGLSNAASRFKADRKNGPLIDKLFEFQQAIMADEPAMLGDWRNAMQEALAAGHRAANLYVQEKGFQPLYPGD